MNKSIFNILLVSILIVALSIGTISAFEFDNIKSFDKDIGEYGKVEIRNSLLGIPFLQLDKVSTLELINNTEVCENNLCSATKEIILYEKGKLVDDVRFINLETNQTTSIISYQFKVKINGVWTDYNYEELPGTSEGVIYEVRLGGELNPFQEVDWQIKAQGQWIEEWAVWTANLNDKLISFFRLDETSGTLADDELEFQDGTANDARIFTAATEGIINTGADFTQGNDYIDLGDTPWDLIFSGNFSISLWANFSSLNAFNMLVSKWSAGGLLFQMGLDSQGDNLLLAHTNEVGGNFDATGSTLLSTGQWYHIVLVKDTLGKRVYLDNSVDINTTITQTVENNARLTFGASYSGAGPTNYADVVMDEIGIWNRSLTPAEVTQLYNSGDGISYNSDPPSAIIISYPEAKSYLIAPTQLNYTLLGTNPDSCWNSVNNGATNSTAVVAGINFTGLSASEGSNTWIVYCNNTLGAESTNSVTFDVDTTFPIINITSPTGLITYGKVNSNLTLSWNVTESSIDTLIYNYNGTNVTVTGLINSTNVTVESSINKNLTFYVKDTAGNEASAFTNWTYKVFENSQTFDATAFETDTETFILNISSDGTETVTANLIYDGTDKGAGTKVGDNSEMTFTRTIQIPTTAEVKSFYWNVSYGSEGIATDARNQTVSVTILSLCNATNTVPFINLTFKDEVTNSSLNATIDASTWKYWLGDGTVNKTLLYSNATENANYTFCFSAVNDTLQNTRTVQYSSAGYPQRTYVAITNLTNSSLNKTLLLLSTSDGIEFRILTQSGGGSSLPGVTVTAERDIDGTFFTVGQGNTDDSGIVSLFVNPNFNHRVTFQKSGCTAQVLNIQPTTVTYIVTMQCADDLTVTTIYASPIEGIRYAVYPLSGILNQGTYNFSYVLNSTQNNITSARFEIVNASNAAILSSISSSCTSSGCVLWMEHTINLGDYVKGRYYVNIGGIDLLIEGDAFWKGINDTVSDYGTIKSFMENLNLLFNNWDGEDIDSSNRQEYSRFVVIFFFFCLFYIFFNKYTGYDSANPGMIIYFLFAMIFMGSLAGGRECINQGCQGLFYYGGLFGQTPEGKLTLAAGFINNYILVTIVFFIMAGHLFSVARRNS